MRRLVLSVVAGLLALTLVAPATASTRSDIFDDCQDDGQLSGDYSPSELRDARKNLPTDLREYSDCEDVLRRAELPGKPDPTPTPGGGGTGTTTGGTTTGGGTTFTPPASGGGSAAPAPTAPAVPESDTDVKALADAGKAGEQALDVDDRTIIPVASGVADGPRANDLPGALVVALVLLGVAGLALSVPPLRRRVGLLRKRP